MSLTADTPNQNTLFIRSSFVLVLFVLIAGVILMPRTTEMHGRLHAGPDPKVLIWSMNWVHHAILTEPWNFFRAPIFYPHTDSFAYSDSLLAPSLLVLPFRLLTTEPTILFNLATWIAYALSGFGMYLLARYLSGSDAIGIIAGIFFAFSPFRLDNITHLQYASQQWLPLLVYAFLRFFFERRKRWLFAAAACAWLTALSCATYLVMAVIPVALFLGVLWLARPLSWKETGFLAIAGLVLILALAPFYLPLYKVTQEIGLGPNLEEVVRFSPDLFDFAKRPKYLTAEPFALLPEKIKTPYFSFFPGFLLSAAVIAALLLFFRGLPARAEATRDKPAPTIPFRTILSACSWTTAALVLAVIVRIVIFPSVEPAEGPTLLTALFWGIIVCLGVSAVLAARAWRLQIISRTQFLLRLFLLPAVLSAFFSLGPEIYVGTVPSGQNVYGPFYSWFPGFKTLRQVLQFNTFTLLFIVPAAALALERLRHLPKRVYAAVMVLFAFAIAFEYRTDMTRDFAEIPTEAPEIYTWMAQQGPSPYIELPVWGYPHHPEADRMYWNMYARQPMVTGQFSYWPVEYYQLVDRAASFPSRESIAYIEEAYTVRFLIVRIRHFRAEQLEQAETLLTSPHGRWRLARKDDYFWLFENSEWKAEDYYARRPPKREP